jgi:protein-tyrosine phosphatase
MPTPKSRRRAASPSRTNGPSEVSPGVYVGGWKEAVNFEGTRFCVLDEAPEDMPAATHIPIYNEGRDRADPKSLDRLAEAMAKARAKGEPVLVFCGHGVRRSPLGAAWYLHRTEGLPLDAAYARVAAVRPRIERAVEWVGNADELESA